MPSPSVLHDRFEVCVFGLPTKFPQRLGRISYQVFGVTGSAGSSQGWDRQAGNPFGRGNDLTHGVPLAIAEVIGAHPRFGAL